MDRNECETQEDEEGVECNMKKRKECKCKICKYLVITAIVCFAVIPFAINWLFKQSAPVSILEAEWEASDALGYVSGMLSFIGTMFLGWISWKQNHDLQKREDNSFIAENSCAVLLDKATFKIGDNTACNYELHPETIAKSNALPENVYEWKSFECEITLQHMKNIPIVVRVLSASILVENQFIEFTKYDNCFTRVAVFKNHSKFNLILLVTAKEKEIVEAYVGKGKCPITLAVKFEIASDRYVSTTLKCRSTLKHCGIENEAKYASSDDASMCFGYGSKILVESEIQYRVQDKEAQPNG